MIAMQDNFPKLTPEEYFEWEAKQELRYEYLDGEVYAMSGGTVNHGQIAGNSIILLGNYLRGSGCRVLTSDVRIKIQKSTKFVYPDISVSCDDRDKNATQFISYPCLIVEVLSPSTEAYDRGKKFNWYRQSDSLQDYILVNADKIEIDLYERLDGDKWKINTYVEGDLIELKSINLTFSIEQLYEGITFSDDLLSL